MILLFSKATSEGWRLKRLPPYRPAYISWPIPFPFPNIFVSKTLISEGFRQLELNRIQATVATENYPSQAVCDRLGLKKEALLRQAEWVNDHFVDLTMNSVLRGEW